MLDGILSSKEIKFAFSVSERFNLAQRKTFGVAACRLVALYVFFGPKLFLCFYLIMTALEARPLQNFVLLHRALDGDCWRILNSDEQATRKREALFERAWHLGLRCPNAETVCTMTALIHFREHILLDDAQLYVKNRKVAESFQSLRRRNEKLAGRDSMALDELCLEHVPDKEACQFEEQRFENLRRKIPSRNTNGSLKVSGSGVMDLFSRLQQFTSAPVPGMAPWFAPQVPMAVPAFQQLALPAPPPPEPARPVATPQVAATAEVPQLPLALPDAVPSEPKPLSMLEAAEKFRCLAKTPVTCERETVQKEKENDTVQKEKDEVTKEVSKTKDVLKQPKSKQGKNAVQKKGAKKNVKKPTKTRCSKGSNPDTKKVSKSEGSKAGSKPKAKAKSDAKKSKHNDYDPWPTIPMDVQKPFLKGCCRCRFRRWCTRSCWQKRGYSV